MKRSLGLLFALGCILCAAGVANAQVLIGGALNNGDLDQIISQEISPGPPPFFLPKPAVWQNTGSRTITGAYEDEMSSEPWAGPAPTPVTTNGTGFPFPDGCGGTDCAVFFKPFSGNVTPNGLATGNLFQDVPVVPGMSTYVMTGWAGGEANALITDFVFAVEFLDGGGVEIPASGTELSLLPTLLTPNGEAFNYKKYTVIGTAPAGAVSVRARASMIGAQGNPAGGGQAIVIDDFTLTAVPEPATFALVGLAVVGLMGIRRRSS
jgi:hypothetical protein